MELRDCAKHAVQLRRDWEAAVQISDPAARVAALWPYLSMEKYGVGFFEHTQTELKKNSPAAGLYFAEQFEHLEHAQRMLLLGDAGAFGSDELRLKVRDDITQQRNVYEEFVSRLGRLPVQSDWQRIPASVIDASGEIYYGLAGLTDFRNREDLPFIRDTATWAVKYHREQIAEAALTGFYLMPDKANLPAIDAIRREFNSESEKVFILDKVERALCAHVFPETTNFRATHCR